MPEISIIIPTYNEAAYIRRTLESIKRQPYKNFEVILADSESSDGTRRIARNALKGIRIVSEKRRSVGAACNKAARTARGRILLFIDADTSVSKTLLKAYASAFSKRGVIAATGPLVPLEKADEFTRLGYRLISVGLVKLLIRLGIPSIIGSNFAALRNAFIRSGGFNEDFVTYHDWDLSRRLGAIGRVAYAEHAVALTSTRRIRKWGAARYFTYHTVNALRYAVFHRASSSYEPIR